MISCGEIIERLQQNYTVRPATMDDARQVADLMNICSQQLIGKDETDQEELSADWDTPEFEMQNNSLMVLDGENLIAYAELWGTTPPHVKHTYTVRVHPNFRNLRIGTQMNQWAEAQACSNLYKAPAELQVILTCLFSGKDTCARAIMKAMGSQIVRSTWIMEADLSQPWNPESLPEGYLLRVVSQNEIPEIFALKQDCFQDHWGNVATNFNDGLQQFITHYVNDPYYRSDLWFVIEYQGEKIGLIIGNASTTYGKDYGWVNVLGVKREHRKKGIGRVLLQHCNLAIKNYGSVRVGLSVDSTNLTGATKLYENAGFKIIEEYLRYEKVLRDGVDIRTRSLSN